MTAPDADTLRAELAALRARLVALEEENAALRREHAFGTLADQLPDVVARFDQQCRYRYVNPAITAETGLTPDQVIGRTIRELGIPGTFVERWETAIAAVFADGEARRFDYAYDGGGHVRHYRAQVVPERDAQGTIVGVIGVHSDITEAHDAAAALRASEARYRSLFESVPVGLYRTSPAGEVLEFNNAALRIVGYPDRETLLRTPVAELYINPAERDAWKATLDLCDEVHHVVARLRRYDGSSVWVDDSARVVRDAQGRIAAYEGVLVDIDEQRRAVLELRRQNEYLTALHDTALALMNRLDLNEVLQAIVARAAALVGSESGYLYLRVPDEPLLEVKVATGIYAGYIGVRIARGEGLSGRVWAQGRPLVVHDYSQWEDRVHRFDAHSWETIVAVPLLSGGEVVGVLGTAYERTHEVRELTVIAQLERFAQLAAIALDNARLYTASQQEIAERRRAEAALRANEQQLREMYVKAWRQARELELLSQVRLALARELDLGVVLRTVVEGVAETFGYTLVSIYLLEGSCLVLQHQIGYSRVLEHIPLDRGVMARAVRSGRPILVEDVRTDPEFLEAVEGISSEVCVPLFHEGAVFGALNVESQGGGVLTEDDLRVMVALGEHISIAIGRAQLYTSLRRRLRELDALRTTMTEISRNLNLDTLLTAILERGLELMSAVGGELGLYDPQSQTIRVQVGYNLNRDYVGTVMGLGEGVLGQVALTRRPILVPSYHAWDLRSAQYDGLADATILGVPLLAGEELIGVIAAVDTNTERRFTIEDIELLSLFAQQATIAIQNARLFGDVQLLATSDSLMGLANRRHFFALAQREFERSERHGYALSALMLDIDDFKRINDLYGHAAGDQVLRAVGARCRAVLRSVDVVGRYGGEEVVALLPQTEMLQALQVADRLRQSLEQHVMTIDGTMLRVTGSIGVASCRPGDGSDLEALVDQADRALLLAKQSGKNCVVSLGGPSLPARLRRSAPVAETS